MQSIVRMDEDGARELVLAVLGLRSHLGLVVVRCGGGANESDSCSRRPFSDGFSSRCAAINTVLPEGQASSACVQSACGIPSTCM